MEVSGQLQAKVGLPPEQEPRYPLCRTLGGPQSRSGRRGEEKILDLAGTRIPNHLPSSPWPVAIPTELFRLIGLNAMEKRKFLTVPGLSIVKKTKSTYPRQTDRVSGRNSAHDATIPSRGVGMLRSRQRESSSGIQERETTFP
jgi:hypothetical protein